jgi:glycine/D-amino acid oxidase-like deaminating enzyme
MAETADAVIIGGGCMGASIALHLARRGLRPILLEKNTLASGPTGKSTAVLAGDIAIAAPAVVIAARPWRSGFAWLRVKAANSQ